MSVGAIFVDGANMSRCLTARFHGKVLIDYGLLVEALVRIFGIPFQFKAYYTTHQDTDSAKRREPFYVHLRKNGWTVFSSQAKFVRSGDHPDGIWMDKGVDLAIGLDAYRLALSEKNLSVLAVATHDTDFVELFRRLPPSVSGVSVGWKNWLSQDLSSVSRPVYLDEIGVTKR